MNAFAEGVGSRGGGRALVCRNSAGKITSAKMLDVLEGTESKPYGYSYAISETQDASLPQVDRNLRVDRIINNSLAKLEGLSFFAPMKDEVVRIKNESILEKTHFDLFAPEDMGFIHLKAKPDSCKLEVAGVYLDDDHLHINPDILLAMDSTNQASFFLHEGIYSSIRKIKTGQAGSAFIDGSILSGTPSRPELSISNSRRKLGREFLVDFGS